jgi:hypothetical protein
MNKGIQIVSLILLFSVCGAAGYFIGEVFDKKELQTDNGSVPNVVEISVAPDVIEATDVPEDILSTKPKITNSPTPVKNIDDKTYSLVVAASVESGDSLVYYITKDDKGNKQDATNVHGKFNRLYPSSNGKYYVWVENTETHERDSCVVSGFDPIKVKRLTANEINQSLNSTTDGFVPEEISSRFAYKHSVINVDDGKILFEDFNLLWEHTYNKIYKFEVVDVKVDPLTNMLTEIRVKVIK